ncbi:PP2C family protein-serine/threonine phosphatase [Phragmitibacter flavus]|uniref:PP2C family protein-serine/threonine phosphatase n=1 Tax=Phragmitibacter flavus TaxID=2576071 RepID=UPI001407677F|nr:SpoIIE family protein phosphatase [Phragmitibacter flavus]
MTEQPTQPLIPTPIAEEPTNGQLNVTFVTDRDFAGRQLVGSRSKQEDFYAFSDVSDPGEPALTQLLVGLGDGLGAHSGGNLASAHLVTEFIKAYKSTKLAESWRMRIALEQANDHLDELSKRYGGLLPMGTTFIGLHITRTFCQWISVGDSPLFIFRNGKLERLNADHSLTPILEDRVRNGEITEEESLAHPDRHILQSACMGQPLTLVDARTYPYDLHSGDILLAASDGILTLGTKEIEELLLNGSRNSAAKLANSLLFAIRCVDHPRQDNVTIALVKVP